MNELVTLRTSGPQTPQNFYRLATRILQTYGVSAVYENGIVVFESVPKGTGFQPPLIVSGRAQPNVPTSQRPVFQLVELNTVRISDVSQWLDTAFVNSGLQIQPDPNRNAIVLFGKGDLVAQAVAAIRVLDRPFMRGRVSARLEPGLHGGQGGVQAASVVVLPVAASNTVIIFAADREALEHAVEWARSIDQPNPTAGDDSLFYYTVRNTLAEEIVNTLNGIRDTSNTRAPVRDTSSLLNPATTVTQVAAVPAAAAAATPASPEGGALGSLTGGRLLLDGPRNALIFQGKASDWGRVLPLIKQMDQAPRQVMIEVTIAEVSLDASEEFGVSWLAKNDIGRYGGTVSSGLWGSSSGSGAARFTTITGGKSPIWNQYGHERIGWAVSTYNTATP